MGLAELVIRVARSQLGYMEQGAPNATIYGHWFGAPNQPWCATFLSWCFAEAGASLPAMQIAQVGFAGVELGLRWADKHDWITQDPKPGDIVFFRWSKSKRTVDHVGLVEGVLPNGDLVTIEGNTSMPDSQFDGVARRCRKRDMAIAFMHPPKLHGPYPALPVDLSAPYQAYCLGLCFTSDFRMVQLIQKARPAWQTGLLNGVGGKNELGEMSRAAMNREWAQETGIAPPVWDPVPLSWLVGPNYHVAVFTGSLPIDQMMLAYNQDVTEPLVRVAVNDIAAIPSVIDNVRYLVEQAVDPKVSRPVIYRYER